MDTYYSAKKIIDKLRGEGFTAYFAGGWVRDYLLGHPSSDIDIATNAPPEKILKLFKRTVPVGISFGVVIVIVDNHPFEVSTFRKDVEHEDGRRPAKIVLTNEQEDALRRDFTINGMFYDPFEDRVIDYVGGQEDLKKGIVRAIGDPDARFKEDRLRMIRAIRFAFRFNYKIDLSTYEAIKQQAKTLFPAVSMERIWQEFKKMTAFQGCDLALVEMARLGLLQIIFPLLASTPLEEIKARVSSFHAFPRNCPPIVHFMELFPNESLKTLIAICHYLKISNKEQKIVEYIESIRACIEGKQSSEDADFAKLYADPFCDSALEIVAARFAENERMLFLQSQKAKKIKLQPHIERIINKTPLITSGILVQEGIMAGKIMGQLLSQAERIAVNHDIHSTEMVLNLLKQTENWPK